MCPLALRLPLQRWLMYTFAQRPLVRAGVCPMLTTSLAFLSPAPLSPSPSPVLSYSSSPCLFLSSPLFLVRCFSLSSTHSLPPSFSLARPRSLSLSRGRFQACLTNAKSTVRLMDTSKNDAKHHTETVAALEKQFVNTM